MDRSFLTDEQRYQFFENLRTKACLSWPKIASEVGIHHRTLWDWRNGKYSIPTKKLYQLEKKFNLAIPQGVIKRPQFWHIREAGRLGAIARNQKYGNPGTKKGRSKGGKRSILTHKRLGTTFKTEKDITYPKKSTKLAEFIGIVLGDGGISRYQLTITLDLKRDYRYSQYVSDLVKKLFDLESPIYKRPYKSTVSVVVSSKRLVEFLVNQRLVIGNKIRQAIDVPIWVHKRTEWQSAFLRGIFDTDGSVYLDKHRIKGKVYKNLGMTFTSYSQPLLKSIKFSLEKLDFSPTSSHRNAIFLRKEAEIKRYFLEVRTHNPKHQERFSRFLREKSLSLDIL